MKLIHNIFTLVFFVGSLFSAHNTTEQEFLSYANSFERVSDYHSAIKSLKIAQLIYRDSVQIKKSLAKVYNKIGSCEKSYALTKEIMNSNPTDYKEHFHLIEDLAWSVLNHKALVDDPTYYSALSAALITGDVKAIEMLAKALNSSNFFVRYVALKHANRVTDRSIQRILVARIKKEKIEPLRCELSKTLCNNRLPQARIALEEILASASYSSQEKGFAVHSLCHLYPILDHQALLTLMQHKKSVFRSLSIHVLKKKKVAKAQDYLKKFLQDPVLSVRQSAVNALIDHSETIGEDLVSELKALAATDHPTIMLNTALVLLKKQNHYSQQLLLSCLDHNLQEVRFAAAYLIGKTHAKEEKLISSIFEKYSDPFLRVNLAISLFENGARDAFVINEIENLLHDSSSLMMQNLGFCSVSIIKKSTVGYTPQIQDYPKICDLGVRLHLMNMLCVADSKKVHPLMKQFLKERMWGVSASTAMLLIQEGPVHAIELVEKLVNDKDKNIALQACLVLAFLKNNANVVDQLIEHYSDCSYQLKLTILEALGRIGDKKAIQFLLHRLEDPFQTTNIVAASSIIQCLYH